jgi:hypothetical protein
MDVCAFAGVAPRGPVRVPVFDEKWLDDRPCVEPERPRRRSIAVAVESFDEYRGLFGGFEGPGLLPYAVAAFFEQGGQRAYIVRVVHDYRDAVDPTKPDPIKNAGGVASGVVPFESTNNLLLQLDARNEGSWGNQLRASIDFATRVLDFVPDVSLTSITVADGTELPAGSLLRLTLADKTRELRLIDTITRERRETEPGFRKVGIFNLPLPAKIESAEVVDGILTVEDGDGRFERHERLGFSQGHPRWIATVLCYESLLVFPAAAWIEQAFIPADKDLVAGTWSNFFSGGEDRYADIIPDDFFSSWVLGDDRPGDGVHALVQLSDLSSLVVPDLYSPEPISPIKSVEDPISLAGPEFASCVTLAGAPKQTEPAIDLKGLRLNPRDAVDRETIIRYQKLLVDLADGLHSFIVLLDVPPGLSQRQILTWRTRFDSAFAAAYHPWLRISRNDDERELLKVTPSAVAAGIIARQEIVSGVPTGPANVIAAHIVDVDDVVSPVRHDELHPEGINVYLRERDGVRLTAARTLSRDPQWRQLSVRRLITMIERAIYQQMQWVVFEANNLALRTQMRLALQSYLRQLFRAGAFRGATEDQAFFVRCDDTNNPPFVADAGRLIVEIGVAPAEPLEFIVLQLTRGGDGTLTLEER